MRELRSSTNKYLKIASLGGGGMGDVSLAVARGPARFSKLVVLKELRVELARTPDLVARFLDEARLAARLSHPCIVQTHEVGSQDGRLFIVMEYLEGQPLHRVLGQVGTLSLGMRLSIIAEVLSALEYAHDLADYEGTPLNIVHRDVTPHNVFLTYDGQVKLLDFGIATALDSSARDHGGIQGKAAYMSPEQALGLPVDRRSDLYAVGVMLWELIAGRRMWPQLDEIDIIDRVLSGDLPSMTGVDSEVPAGLERIATWALEREPDARPKTAGELREALLQEMARLDIHGNLSAVGESVAAAFQDERRELVGRIQDSVRKLRIDSASDRERTPVAQGTTPFAFEAQAEPPPLQNVRTLRPPAYSRRLRRGHWLTALAVTAGAAAIAVSYGLGRVQETANDESSVEARTGLLQPAAPVPPTAESGCARSNKPIIDLNGPIDADARLTCERDYRLNFNVFVEPGVTLTIEPGTTLRGNRETRGTLVVKPGARLIAIGTPTEPIVFTSEAQPGRRKPGDWGGVIILGNAPVNLKDPEGRPRRGQVEGITLGGEYGGGNPNDDSGVVKYVRIEYGGVELAPGNEINGLTLAGVGSGTTIDYVQVRHVSDDCFEFFGGTVNAKHLICQYNGDDGFDWDYGYRGKLQFLVLQQDPSVAENCNGLEGDNAPDATVTEPRSAPVIYNATLCGKNVDPPREQYGVLLRRGTHAVIGNSFITGFEAGLDVVDASTTADIRGSYFRGNLVHDIAYSEKGGSGPDGDDDAGFDEIAAIEDPSHDNKRQGPAPRRCFDATAPVFAPERPIAAGAPPDDGYFDPDARFVGAVRDENDTWPIAPWTLWSAN